MARAVAWTRADCAGGVGCRQVLFIWQVLTALGIDPAVSAAITMCFLSSHLAPQKGPRLQVPGAPPAPGPLDSASRIAQKQEEIQNLTETLTRVRRDYLGSVDEDQRTLLARNRQELTSDLEAAQAELKVLAARLQELKPEAFSMVDNWQWPRTIFVSVLRAVY